MNLTQSGITFAVIFGFLLATIIVGAALFRDERAEHARDSAKNPPPPPP